MKKKLVYLLVALGLGASTAIVSGCKKERIDNSQQSSVFLTVEKKNMSFIQKYTGTWCSPCGSWGFPAFAQLIAEYGSTDAFGAVVSGDMGPVSNNEAVFEATGDMYGSAITGTPTFLCNMQVINATSTVIEAHRNSPVVANANYELKVEASAIHIKTTSEFFQDVEGKDFYLFPYVIVDDIVANQLGHPDGANTKHKKTIVDVAYPAGMDENSLKGYKIAEGTIKSGYKFNLEFEADRAASWEEGKISVVLVIATKGTDGKFKFVNAYTKH